MRRVAKAGAALARSGAWRDATGRGIDLAVRAGDTVAEALRTRRDPALIAERRRVAARRRLLGWSLVGLVLAALSVAGVLSAIGGDVSAGLIGALVLAVGLLVYSLIGAVRAAVDLRARTLIVRRLPAPQPRRPSVTPAIRPLMARLDGYSDALRQVVSGIGLGGAGTEMHALRNQTLAAADAAESRLRAQAAELTAVTRSGAGSGDGQLAAARQRLRRGIEAGVDEYGRLVAAASDAAAASRELAAATPTGEMTMLTERLTALAAGMRELTGQDGAGDTTAH